MTAVSKWYALAVLRHRLGDWRLPLPLQTVDIVSSGLGAMVCTSFFVSRGQVSATLSQPHYRVHTAATVAPRLQQLPTLAVTLILTAACKIDSSAADVAGPIRGFDGHSLLHHRGSGGSSAAIDLCPVHDCGNVSIARTDTLASTSAGTQPDAFQRQLTTAATCQHMYSRTGGCASASSADQRIGGVTRSGGSCSDSDA